MADEAEDEDEEEDVGGGVGGGDVRRRKDVSHQVGGMQLVVDMPPGEQRRRELSRWCSSHQECNKVGAAAHQAVSKRGEEDTGSGTGGAGYDQCPRATQQPCVNAAATIAYVRDALSLVLLPTTESAADEGG